MYNYQPYYSYVRTPQDSSLIKDIENAINAEYSAIICYKHLADVAPSKNKKQILEIRNDEIKHFKAFTQIYMNITGQQPTPQITEECPRDYKDGLDFAFQDEQKAVDFYLDITDRAQDPYIKDTFRRAAADEQNHAVWFLNFLTRG